MSIEAREPAKTLLTIAEYRICARIGQIVLALKGDGVEGVFLSREMDAFRVEDCDADIEIDVEWVDRLHSAVDSKTFDSGALWTFSREEGDLVFDFASPWLGSRPYKRMVVNKTFRSAQVLLSREALEDLAPIYPLEYPADELLITNYLAHSGLGVEVHGCGLIDTETGGHLFLGHSGAGKSTTTQLWQARRNPEILSDDRLILRLRDGELWMYGTPWHGEAGFASPQKAKLERIFFLQHGMQNQMREMSRSQAVGELFARSFPPFHDAAALDRTVGFLSRIIEMVPCYEFRFVPDESAVGAVLAFHD